MKNRIYLLCSILLLNIMGALAQKDSIFWNNEMIKIATATSNADWINIKPDVLINPLTFFTNQKKTLNLSADDDMRLYKTEVDKIGFTHYRYQQFYKGYKIIFAEFLLHAKDGRLTTANGKMIRGLKKDPVIKISKTEALQSALRFLPAAQYAWEIPQLENSYKEILHDQNATYKPVGELVWISSDEKDDIKNAAKYELAFMFDVYTASLTGKRIFVSAGNGRIIKSFPLTPECDATSATTNFYGTQGFSTSLIPGAPPRWYLWNDCQPAFIRTQKWAANGMNTDYISGPGNTWSALTSEVTSHWCMEKTYDYYLNIFARNGWNGANAGVFILQDALFPCAPPPPVPPPPCPNGQNASFSNGFMLVGNADNANTIDDYNSLDIIAHEFTHGVTTSSANLVYNREPGALNESFSDILGVSCHAWLFGLSANTWKVGFDRKNPNNTAQSIYLRNMSNPNDAGAGTPSPDTYLSEPLWVNTTTAIDSSKDNWGVHTNSGVQNYMYYLLVSGGSGTNDNGTPFSLIGIGISAAREVAYRALTVYLSSSSTFSDARDAWVHSAVDLYGECSFQAIETGKAWNAVGLAPPANSVSTPYCGTYGGAVFSVTNPDTYSLAPNCVMNIIPSSLVQFGANRVIINPGFKAQNGSHFRAYVSDCRFAAY